MLSIKQIIRNINLHILTGMELDSDIMKVLDDLNSIFKDLNIYKSDRYKDTHLTFYGYSKENLSMLFYGHIGILDIYYTTSSYNLYYNIFLKYEKHELYILLDLIKHYINLHNRDEAIESVCIDSFIHFNQTPTANLYKIGAVKNFNL